MALSTTSAMVNARFPTTFTVYEALKHQLLKTGQLLNLAMLVYSQSNPTALYTNSKSKLKNIYEDSVMPLY